MGFIEYFNKNTYVSKYTKIRPKFITKIDLKYMFAEIYLIHFSSLYFPFILEYISLFSFCVFFEVQCWENSGY